MSGGYQADTAQLGETGTKVKDIPEQALEQPLAAVEHIAVAPLDFGRAHQHHFNDYAQGAHAMVTCAKSYLTASASFGQKLTAAAGQYQTVEGNTGQQMGAYQ